MESEKVPVERRWWNAILLFLAIFVACALIALLLVKVLPSNVEWAGIPVSLVIATMGTLAGVIGCLCVVIVIDMKKP